MAHWFTIASALILTMLAGCASSQEFDRDAMRAMFWREDTQTVAHQSPEMEIENSSPPTPFRLALYFVENDFPPRLNIRKAEWIGTDKDVLANSLAPLKREGIAADIFLLTDSAIRGHDIREIRNAAARYGADAVLIIQGIGAVDRSNNAYAALYVTVVGAYVAPGTVGESLFLIESDLWDTRVERLYATQRAEGHAQVEAAAMKLDDRAMHDLAKKSALADLGRTVSDELIRLKQEKRPSHNQLR